MSGSPKNLPPFANNLLNNTLGTASAKHLDVYSQTFYTVMSPTNNLPEKVSLNLGFIPLTDCAPLVIAKEKGFFHAEGLSVSLSRESSWANIRDKVAAGVLDGGHMLAPMPIAASLNLDGLNTPMLTALSLGLGGNAITVSHALHQQLLALDAQVADPYHSVQALKTLISQQQRAGLPPLTFAHVFPFSCHNYLLRYWLASAGIDPDKDVRLVVIPPPLMVSALASGQIDGFCVGEPWNSQAIAQGIGAAVTSTVDIWHNSPEKVLGVTCAWAEQYPNTHQALLRALLKSAQWLELSEHRAEACAILTAEEYVPVAIQDLRVFERGEFQYSTDRPALQVPDFNVFYRYAATFPWVSHAEWLISQMQRWGHIPPSINAQEVAAKVYRPDLYRQAAQALELPSPLIDRKNEGSHNNAWLATSDSVDIAMGRDCFFDQVNVEPRYTDA
ncbi:MAG: CmpA/NrtA family ABC transporter substrate-binding protein [Methylococcaceae bacterium]|nr:CmpA/NrtA family ABC transporter substrate-binding protein [Methylococcaceae bacterium]